MVTADANRVGDAGRYRVIDADSGASEHGHPPSTGLGGVDDLDRTAEPIREQLTPQRAAGSPST
jgi:polynucleotide 5'-kinase involved in rRNA processing